MARIIFFLSFLLLTFACLQPTHAVEYQIINKAENTPGGTKFTNEIGVDYTRQTLDAATNFIWRLFQQSTDADRKNVATVTFIVEYFNGTVKNSQPKSMFICTLRALSDRATYSH